MTWWAIVGIVVLTILRTGWIARRPLPPDVPKAIMLGLGSIGKFLRRETKVSGNAPYGIIWYAINFPLARLGHFDGRLWMILLSLIDSVFVWLSLRLGIYGILAYVLIGTFQLLRAPWNVTINWLIILGLFYWWFLLIAPIAKLPFGMPLNAWEGTGRSLTYKHNYVYYGLLVTFWLIIFVSLYGPLVLDTTLIVFGSAWSLTLSYLYVRRWRRASP